jgi:ribosomal protein L37AE/L43A
MEILKFICPKCAHDRVSAVVGTGMLRCKSCGFTAVHASFNLEKRPSLKWDEAIEIRGETYE